MSKLEIKKDQSFQSGGSVSDILQYVEVHTWSTSQCEKAFDDFNNAHQESVQFGGDGKEICAYDTVSFCWI